MFYVYDEPDSPEAEDERLERAWQRKRQHEYMRCASCHNPDSMYFDEDPNDYLNPNDEDEEND